MYVKVKKKTKLGVKLDKNGQPVKKLLTLEDVNKKFNWTICLFVLASAASIAALVIAIVAIAVKESPTLSVKFDTYNQFII